MSHKHRHTPRTDCSRNSAMVSVLSESIDRANVNSPSTSMKFSFSRARRRQSGCRTRDYAQTHTHTQITHLDLCQPEAPLEGDHHSMVTDKGFTSTAEFSLLAQGTSTPVLTRAAHVSDQKDGLTHVLLTSNTRRSRLAVHMETITLH